MKHLLYLTARELLHRRVNFFLSTLAVTLAVAASVGMSYAMTAMGRETRRVMRDLGFNLKIIPATQNIDTYLLTGQLDQTMPEDVLHRLASQTSMTYNHLVATLRSHIEVAGYQAMLVGVSEELFPPGRKKPIMQPSIERGLVHLGDQIASRLNVQKGDNILIRKHSFVVARRAPKMGNADDLRILCSLADAQMVLGMPDRINEIQAIDCMCQTSDHDPRAQVLREVKAVAPEAEVVMLTAMADARAKQRQLTERYASIVLPVVLVISSAWVCILAALNVHQRREEIGLLRSLGYTSKSIFTLFMSKALFVGLAAGLLGFGLGTLLSTSWGPRIFPITAKAIRVEWSLLGWSLLAAPLFAAISSLVPAVFAVQQDPAMALRDD